VHKLWQRAVVSSLPFLQSVAPSQTRSCCRHSPDRQVNSSKQSVDDEDEEEEDEEEEGREEAKDRDGR
jgi:hypothetical protein